MAKRSSLLGNLLVLGLVVISVLVWQRVYQIYSAPQEKCLEVNFINVGQGDSILITTPGQKHILIDGGTFPRQWSKFDAGKMVVVPYLKSKHIKKLDLVVATHPDLDHIGGLIAVLRDIPVDLFLDSGTISTTQTYEILLRLIDEKNIKFRIAAPGDISPDPQVTLQVLSPISPAFKNAPNDNSIVIKVLYGNVSFLLTGDITNVAESMYIQKYGEELAVTILKLGHHGSKSSSSGEFLEYTQPEAAIISCGRNNPFGHPSPEVIERLDNMDMPSYRTDQQGTITIKTDGKQYSVYTQK